MEQSKSLCHPQSLETFSWCCSATTLICIRNIRGRKIEPRVTLTPNVFTSWKIPPKFTNCFISVKYDLNNRQTFTLILFFLFQHFCIYTKKNFYSDLIKLHIHLYVIKWGKISSKNSDKAKMVVCPSLKLFKYNFFVLIKKLCKQLYITFTTILFKWDKIEVGL